MGVPSIFAVVIAGVCAVFVRKGPLLPEESHANGEALGKLEFLTLFRRPQFLITCGLCFTVTLMREAFNTWSVDFLVTVQGDKSVVNASLQSTAFDLAGLVSVFVAGVAYDKVAPARRRWLMAGSLALLAGVLVGLSPVARAAPLAGAGLVGLAGLLVYGPYSLLAGTLAVESGGVRLAATAAGIIDGAGYIAGSLAGVTLGRLLDVDGYSLGFGVLAAITALSAAIALALHPTAEKST